jgi:hypothetical protein
MSEAQHVIEYRYVDSVSRFVKWPIRVVRLDQSQFNWSTPEGDAPDEDEVYRRVQDFEQRLTEQQESKKRHVVILGVTGYFPKEWDYAVEPLMIAEFADAYRKDSFTLLTP